MTKTIFKKGDRVIVTKASKISANFNKVNAVGTVMENQPSWTETIAVDFDNYGTRAIACDRIAVYVLKDHQPNDQAKVKAPVPTSVIIDNETMVAALKSTTDAMLVAGRTISHITPKFEGHYMAIGEKVDYSKVSWEIHLEPLS